MEPHKGAAASTAAIPDVCKVPAPAGPVPIPYPNAGPMATGWETTNAVKRVKLQTEQGVSATQASRLTSSMGDEPGTAAKGIVSHKQIGKASFVTPASTVKVEGANAIRHLDVALNRF